ncbi:DUF4272 domain-containing protein [Saccharospirillum sp. HFRX-1]|uniref:DUF4272 domain-containing protein n=1 Tax=unclassified Saccharospirillum TaxID=2633430 RepID=UPI003711F8B0
MDTNDLKIKSETYLTSLGIQVPSHLPKIESLDDVNPKTATQIASRLCALTYVIGMGFGAKHNDLLDDLQAYNLMDFVSPKEQQLLSQESLTEQQRINMAWQVECAQALAWCIGVVGFDHFKPCDSDLAQKIPFKTSPEPFIQHAERRSIDAIQEQSDLLYRMHWYVRNCRLSGQESLLNESVITERRKAIDWAYGVAEDWDNVPMDT